MLGALSKKLTLDISQVRDALDTVVEKIKGVKGGFGEAAKAIDPLKAKIKEANVALNKFGDSAKKLGSDMASVGRKMSMGLTLPIVGAGTAAFKLQKDFETAMSQIVGLVGVAQDQVDKWGKDILKMAPRLGKAPKELAEALFFVTSAGLKGAAAMDVLEMSAKASAAGLGETKTVADLVTSAMNAYGQANLSAGKATDILVAAVREGKAEAPELAAAMGGVLPIASEMKVSFEEVGAAVAAMTRTGTNAATATMQLKNIMGAFLKPSKEAEDALNMMGTSSEEFRRIIADDGLFAALSKLKGLQEAYGDTTISQVVPNMRAMLGVFDLVGANMEDNIAIWERMKDTTGALDHAFATTAETADFKWKKAMSAGQVALIQVGATVADFVVPILEKLAGWLNRVSEWWSNLSKSTQKTIIQVLAITAAIGPVILIAGKLVTVIGLASKAFAVLNAIMIANPIGLVVAGIAAIVAYVAIAIKHWDKFGAAMLAVTGPIGVFINIIKSLYDNWDSVVEAFRSDGLLEGLKRIGQVMLSALITPVEQLLKLVGKIPGMKFADNWSADLKKFKEETLKIPPVLKKTKKEVEDVSSEMADLTKILNQNTTAVTSNNNAQTRAAGIYEKLVEEVEKYNALERAATTIQEAAAMRKLADEAQRALEKHEQLVALLSKPPAQMQSIGLPGGPQLETKRETSDDPMAKYKDELEAAKQFYDEDVRMAQWAEDEKARKRYETVDIVARGLGIIGQLQQAAMNKELAMAEGNEAKQTEIRRKYAKKGKAISMGEAVIGAANAVINALQTKPFFPMGAIMAGLAGAMAGAQIATIAATPMKTGGVIPPGFANDTYPALLSSGETVIPAPIPLGGMGGGSLQARLVQAGPDLMIYMTEQGRTLDMSY